MSFDPEFQPAVGFLRGVMTDLDAQVALVEANILEGRCKTLEDYRSQLGTRAGLLTARKAMTLRIDQETMQRLGLKP
jgi:hypothetical protein